MNWHQVKKCGKAQSLYQINLQETIIISLYANRNKLSVTDIYNSYTTVGKEHEMQDQMHLSHGCLTIMYSVVGLPTLATS